MGIPTRGAERPQASALARPEVQPPGAAPGGGARLPAPPAPPRSGRRGAARWVPAAATATVVVVVWAVTLSQLHPELLLRATTTTGGDTGAHFAMPRFLQSLLGAGQVRGWDPSWYNGYPIYTFYFVLPDLLVALAAKVLAYDLVFKWATVLGSLALPVAAWACGRLFRLRPPGPAALAAATLPFLFDYTWHIDGGNLFSTLAGEYSYSLSLALAVLFLGLFARGLRSGRHRGWTALVLACCVLAHIVPGLLALAGAALLTAIELLPARLALHDGAPTSAGATAGLGDRPRPRRQALWWALSTTGIGLLLCAWWLVPFGVRQPYATSMNYANVRTFVAILFPRADLWALVLAGAACVVALAVRSRFAVVVAALGGLCALGIVVDPQGKLYNVRLLPLWFLCVYLLAGWLFAVAAAATARWWRHLRMASWSWSAMRGSTARPPRAARWSPGAVGGALAAALGSCAVVVPPFVVPASFLPVTIGPDQVSAWAAWNYSGYEGKPAYPEYRALIDTMRRVGRQDGCGRAMWEYSPDLNRFGTPESLMLLPYWTGGCIDSMEGLLFESSATTPYHFIDQAELSATPSDPMGGLPYTGVDVPLGVEHLQLLGVRYFLASSPEVRQQAAADPSLRLVATAGPFTSPYGSQLVTTTWDVFEVRDAPLVVPLAYEPAVLEGVGQAQSSWLPVSLAWYDDPAAWPVELAAGGPASWPRVRPAASGAASPPRVPVPATAVSAVRAEPESLRFHVSRIGTPVLVKVSFFPNWHARGAEGPFRVTPNLMVVVPTSHEVTLTYGATGAERLGDALTVAGVLALAGTAARPGLRARRRRPSRHRRQAWRAVG